MRNHSHSAEQRVLAEALIAYLPAPLKRFHSAIGRLLCLNQLEEIHERVSAGSNGNFFDRVLENTGVTAEISEEELARIPKEGPVLAVCNHPFGILDGALVGSALMRARPDTKVLVNSLLRAFPAGDQHFIHVNPFGGPEATRDNLRGMKECLSHLKSGGCLAVFPAGEVAALKLSSASVVDPVWQASVARLARSSQASVLPLFVSGRNSALFQLAGLIHPLLRTLMLGREFVNKRGRKIELRTGNPLNPKRVQCFPDDEGLMNYLRIRSYVLGTIDPDPRPAFLPRLPQPKPAQEPVIDPVPADRMHAELVTLPPDRFLAESGQLQAYIAKSHEIPNLFREIGRLREVTFRAAGEGTGASIDIDTYDAHYLQLFIWNAEKHEIVGAYRLGQTDEIVRRFGKSGLYTSSLFSYSDDFLKRIGTALEMGRSFVRQEYQRSYSPLLLLWQAIGEFCVRNPRYRTLFGPVSISNNYHPVSRQLIVSFFKSLMQMDELAALVRARNPLRKMRMKAIAGATDRAFSWDVQDLDAVLADIETDQKGVPVLLRQYLKLGGKLLSFNLDRAFANALDGLIVVELEKTEPKLLERYMGRDGARAFLAYRERAGARR